MKKTLLPLLLLLCSMVASAQQIFHTIKRGETIESIAQKYHVTIESIKAANPEIAEMIYVGMKILIPNMKQERQLVPSASDSKRKATDDLPIEAATSSVLSNPPMIRKNKEGFVEDDNGIIVHFMPKNDYYAVMTSSNVSKYIYGTMGLDGVLATPGSFGLFFGMGLGCKYIINPIMLIANVYPYGRPYFYDKLANMERILNGNDDKPKYEMAFKLTYGVCAELGLGINIFNTQKNQYYLTGGYCFHAPEFKFDNVAKAGHFFVGLVYVGL